MAKKSNKNLPIYEYDEKVNGQTRYYCRPYISGKQTTIRLDENGNMWLGRDGYSKVCDYCLKLKQYDTPSNYNPDELFSNVIDKMLEDYAETHKESGTYSAERVIDNYIRSFFQDKYKLKDISEVLFFKWHDYISQKKLSWKTKNKACSYLRQIYRYGIQNFGLRENVIHAIVGFSKTSQEKDSSFEHKIRYITIEDFKKFIDVVNDPLWYAFFHFLYFTGMRCGEVIALNWNDIDFTTRKINVCKSITYKTKEKGCKITSTKTMETRTVEMSDKLAKVMYNYFEICKTEKEFSMNDFVFGGKRNLAPTTLTRKKHYYFEKANVPEITIHEFRHSHVSLLINEAVKQNMDMGAFFVIMSKRMGHTIDVMQKTYMHLFPDVQKPIVNLLNGIE